MTIPAPSPSNRRRVRRARGILGVLGVVGALGALDVVTVTLGLANRPRPAPVALPSSTPPTLPPMVAATPAPEVPASTVLASPHGTVPQFAAPGGAPDGTLGTWYERALTLPVVAQQPGWLEVRLPQRPNGSTGWVRAGDVTLSSTLYFVIVDLTARHLTVYWAGTPMGSFPVGIGTLATPTVTGAYFVAVREDDPGPGYGPFALDTSAHSDAISSWEGAGDAIIAIHGPIDAAADAAIGTTGTRISNGCIRMHDTDLAQLNLVPLGTPVDINA